MMFFNVFFGLDLDFPRFVRFMGSKNAIPKQFGG